MGKTHTHRERCIYHTLLVFCVVMYHPVICMCELVWYLGGGCYTILNCYIAAGVFVVVIIPLSDRTYPLPGDITPGRLCVP